MPNMGKLWHNLDKKFICSETFQNFGLPDLLARVHYHYYTKELYVKMEFVSGSCSFYVFILILEARLCRKGA